MAISEASIRFIPDVSLIEKEFKKIGELKNKNQAKLTQDNIKKQTKTQAQQDKLRIKKIKEVNKLELEFLKQGISKEEALKKAKMEAEFSQEKKLLLKQQRLKDKLFKQQLNKEIKERERKEAKSFKNRLKKRLADVATIGAGVSLGNIGQGVGNLVSGIEEQFQASESRFSLQQSLRLKDQKELDETILNINRLRLQTGETFDELSSAMEAFNLQLGDITSPSEQQGLFNQLNKFSDSFVTTSRLVGEYAQAVESGNIALRGGLSRALGGEGQARRFNRLQRRQQLAVDVGLAEDLEEKQFIKEREQFLKRGLAESQFRAEEATGVTKAIRLAQISLNERQISGIRALGGFSADPETIAKTIVGALETSDVFKNLNLLNPVSWIGAFTKGVQKGVETAMTRNVIPVIGKR